MSNNMLILETLPSGTYDAPHRSLARHLIDIHQPVCLAYIESTSLVLHLSKGRSKVHEHDSNPLPYTSLED